MSITAAGGGGIRTSNIKVKGNTFEHAGGNAATTYDLLISGDDAAALVSQVDVDQNYEERTNEIPAPNIGIRVRDCWQCHFGSILGGGTGTGTTFIQISQSAAGRTKAVVIDNAFEGPTYTHIIDDQVDSPEVTLTQAANPFITRFVVGGGVSYDYSAMTLGNVVQLGVTNLLLSSTAPKISSGFGTSPTIPKNNGTAAFQINIGTGGTATRGVIGLPTAKNGWACHFDDTTTQSAAVFVTKQIASSATSATIANFNTSGAQAAWVASDILTGGCSAL